MQSRKTYNTRLKLLNSKNYKQQDLSSFCIGVFIYMVPRYSLYIEGFNNSNNKGSGNVENSQSTCLDARNHPYSSV